MSLWSDLFEKQTFRSFDQFSNMVLDDACERKMHVDLSDGITYYADIPLGLYIVRGDSVVLLGQIGDGKIDEDPSISDRIKSSMKMVDLDELDEKIASAADDKQQNGSPAPAQGDDKGHVLEWDFDKDLVAWSNHSCTTNKSSLYYCKPIIRNIEDEFFSFNNHGKQITNYAPIDFDTVGSWGVCP